MITNAEPRSAGEEGIGKGGEKAGADPSMTVPITISRPPAGTRPATSIRAILTIATSVIGTQVLTSLLGAVFWAGAARSFPATTVGVAAAATSAMGVLGVIGMLGLGTLLIVELPRYDAAGQARILRAALLLAGMVAAGLGFAWALSARWSSEAMRPISENALTVGVFTVGVALTAVTAVFDQAVLIRRRGGAQFLRNLIAAVVKVGLLLTLIRLGVHSSLPLYGVWVLSLAISLPVCFIGIRTPTDGTSARTTGPGRLWGLRELRTHSRTALGHHLVNLALQAPTLLLPVLAALTVSAEETAYFSSARLAATFLFMPPYALAIALFAGSRGNLTRAAQRMRVTLPLGIGISAALYGVAALAAHPILSLFGKEYATQALTPFLLLALAGIPLVVKDNYVAIRRIEGRVYRAAVFVAVGTAAELGVAAVAGWRYGLDGLAFGWTIVVTLEAIIIAPAVLRVIRQHSRPGGASARTAAQT